MRQMLWHRLGHRSNHLPLRKIGGMGVALQEQQLLVEYHLSPAILTWRNTAISPVGIACCWHRPFETEFFRILERIEAPCNSYPSQPVF